MAKANYQQALAVKPGESYPKEMIAKVDLAISGQEANAQAIEEAYKAAIASGDKSFAEKSYEKARTEYQNASSVKPSEQYPKNKIAEIASILEAAAKLKAMEEKYASTIADADKLLADKSYDPARKLYQEASGLKPAEEYPKGKIAEINKILGDQAKQKELEQQYVTLIAEADKLFSQKSYEQSKSQYSQALQMKPGEQYPKDKITEIDKILGDVAALKALDEKYQGIIANADKLLAAKTYDQARTEYSNALTVKPEAQYPKDKIAEIDNAIGALAAQKAKDDQYKASIEKADKLFADKSYDPAKAEYQAASAIKPAEQYPKQKIAEIDNVLADLARQKSMEDQYNTAIASGDKLLGEKTYDAAKIQYQTASSLKPAEKYPKGKIAEIDLALAEIAKLKSLNDQYDALIRDADKLLAAKTYEQARTKYSDAGSLKPAEQYPKDKISEINRILGDMAAQKALEDKYQGIIANADKLLAAKTYDQARTEYSNASVVKPDAQYPKDKIAEIDKALAAIADQKTKDDQYKTSIEKADKLLADKSYDPAKTEYQSALAIKPAEQYPKQKIAEIDKTLADLAKLKALDDQYSSTIASGDKLLGEKSYEAAKTQYQSASTLKPAEKYPRDKIAEIDLALANLAKQKALEDQYQAIIKDADKLLAAKTYEQARTKYTDAGNLKPSEQYPKDKISEINKIMGDMAAQKALEDKYQGIIANADKLLAAKTYDQARTEYSNASAVKPDAQYPKDKIAEIDKALAAIADQKAKDDQYKTSIEKADKLLADKSYDPAKAEYQAASAIKPSEQYPKQKIAEIDKALADLAKLKALDDQYSTAIASGDKLLGEKSYDAAKVQYQSASSLKPNEKYPKDKIAEIDLALADLAKQKALEDQYQAIIKDADKLLAVKTYEQARTKYTDAGNLKPGEQYPKDKISEINKILGDIAAQKALDEKYQGIITNADKLLSAKTYDQARTEYSNASAVKPDAQYPKDKIAEIDKILAAIAAQKAKDDQYKAGIGKADKLLADKSYEPAKTEYQAASLIKPDEEYPRQKIAEIDLALAAIAKQKALDDQYASVIAGADKLLGEKSYDAARNQYQSALLLKPAEKYPTDKIAEIDLALAGIAKQKALDDQYKASIDKADKLLSDKSYELAKAEFGNALKLKPNEQYPKDKISGIDKTVAENQKLKALDDQYQGVVTEADRLLVAKTYDLAKAKYKEAGALKPSEQYPKDKIAEIDTIIANIAHQKEVDDKYRSSIAKADQLMLSKSLEQAKTEYLAAGLLKPDEQYPKTKIAEIDKIFADRKTLDDQYAASIAKADKLLADKTLDLAKAEYQNAGRLKPAEQYPKDKIAEIDKTITELARQKSIDDQYKSSLARADKLFTDKSYEQARTEFTNAGTIKPTEQYPKDKIAEIETILAELKAKEEAYKAAVTKADQFLLKKSYDEAKGEYQNALAIKPNAQYPADKIAEINKTLSELVGKKKLFDDLVLKGDNFMGQKDFYKAKDQFQQALTFFPEDTYAKQRLGRASSSIDSIYRANKGLFDKSVADGDKFYNTFIFDKAIDSYSEALTYLPMEAYPKEMINKIKKIISENAIVDVLKTSIVIPTGEEKQFPFTPTNMASRKNNYVYVKIKNLSDKSFNVLLRYGKDKNTNGGAVIKNLTPDGKVYERLISIRDQDPWYREDNNWIAVYPQGGDVEVSFIQISRSQ